MGLISIAVPSSTFLIEMNLQKRLLTRCSRSHFADAQNLLTKANWSGALLEDVVRREFEGFGDRISINGPRVFLKPSAVQGFALVLHELARNTAKYFAPSVQPRGKFPLTGLFREIQLSHHSSSIGRNGAGHRSSRQNIEVSAASSSRMP